MRAIAEIDSLEIKISASAEQANKAIRNLTRSLGALSSSLKFDTSSLEKLGKINGNNFKKIGEGLQSFSNAARSLQGVDGNNFDKLSQGLSKIASIDPSKLEALGKIDGNSFRGLGEGVKALSAGLKDLKGVSTKKFETLASGIERLGAIQVGNMQTVASALTPLADGIRTLSSANFDNRNLQNLINSLTRLSNANVSGLSDADFAGLGNKIKELATALSSADKVEQNTISMTNAIAKLAGAGANIGTVTTELPKLGKALKRVINGLKDAPKLEQETIAFTQAIGQLANAGGKAETVANSLQHLGNELKRFMQTMATVPNVSANVIQMTQALAQLANAGGGTGRAASSLGNAFNGTSISAIRLSSNTNILSVSLKGLGSRLNKTLKGVKSFTSQMLAAAGIMGGLYGIIRGGLKAMEISSSLTEVQNVVDTTFGNMSDKVQEFADNSIRQFGMSELSVKQFASRFQAMGTAMGIPTSLIKSSNEFLNSQTNGYVGLSDSMSDVSLNLTKLTADIASFYDVEQAEVAEDLAAIYTGMTVPLRKYGLDLTQATLKEWAMKQGLDANIKSMSQAEKTMLRYQYVLANTTAAQGDFAKTADTWANQVRILKQNFEQLGSVIGTSLINAFKPLVQTLNNVLQYVIAFAEKVTEALGTIFGWKYESGGTGGIVQDWSDIADTTGEAADNIDKMKKGLRAFDELNNITSPDKSGGGAGAGGAGEGAGGGLVKTDAIWEKYKSDIDTLGKLGKYIGDTLSKAMEDIDWDSIYQKARNFGRGLAEFLNGLISPRLFENIGKTIAGALNTALHFLDSFGLWFNWKNFGDSLAAGLLGFLNNIQWDVALSAATHWGKGIANTLNHFITPETFSATGNAIAMALNTAVQFALSFGQTFDFKNLGESVAAGINDFFATFNFKDLAATINIWAKGILDAVIKVLDETDWDLIGSQIGEFLADIDLWAIGGKVGKALWKAINAGIKTFASSFSKAPVKTTLITLVAIPKALKAIADTKLIKGIQNLVKYFGKLASTAKLVITALAGNVTSLSTLMTQFPRFGNVVNVATQAFAEFRSGLSSQGFGTGLSQGLTTLNNGITNLRNSLSGLQKGLITAVAGVAEFTVISDVFEGITLGSENLVAGIGKIGAAAGIAAAAMYTALGPAGLVIAGITGVVAAVKGINDAFDEIHAENVGNAINEALTRPGGTDLNEILIGYVNNMTQIGDSFSLISEKSAELENAKKNIHDTVFEIDKIKTSLDAGVMTAEEAVPKLNELYGQLAEAITTKIGAAGNVLLATFADDSISSEAFENAGIKAEEMRGKVVSAMDEQEKAVYDLKSQLENLRNTDPTNPRIPELEAQFARLASGLGEADKAVELLQLDTQKGINWEEYLNEDGLDVERFSAAMTEYRNTIINTRKTAETEFDKAVIAAKELGNEELSNEIKTSIPGAMEYMNNMTAEEAIKLVNTIQEDVVGEIGKVLEDAQSNWKNLSPAEKLKWGNDEQKYVDDYIAQYQNNVVAPLNREIETFLNQLGTDGSAWASGAMEQIFIGMWEFNTETKQFELTQNLDSLIQGAIEQSKTNTMPAATAYGENTVEGYNEAIMAKIGTTESVVGEWMGKVFSTIHDSAMKFGSPSRAAMQFGSDTIIGYNEGLSDNTSSTIKLIGDYMGEVLSKFSEALTPIKEKFIGTWNSIKSKTSEIWGNIAESVKGWVDTLKGWIDDLLGAFGKVKTEQAGMTTGGLGGALGGAFGKATAGISTASIEAPALAKGAVFRGGKPFLAIVNDQPRGQTNVETPLNTIKQALREELASFTDKFNNVQLAPSFEVGQFDVTPPPEFDFDTRQRGTYQIAAEIQQENSGVYSDSDGYNNYSEEASLLMSQNQLLRRQNELLEQLVKKEFGITKSDIGKAARDYSIEYFNRTGNPAYQF